MLISDNKFNSLAVMSLQTGAELARTEKAVIDPYKLEIIAYELTGPLLDQHPSFLRIEDIREIGPMGMIIDSADELVGIDDVIKLKEIYDLNFSLDNIKVVDERKHQVGRVIGYTIEAERFIIQQLRVKRPLLRSFGDVELLIHRSQIIDISRDRIVVKSPTIRHTQPLEVAAQTFENPFRKQPSSQSNSSRSTLN